MRSGRAAHGEVCRHGRSVRDVTIPIQGLRCLARHPLFAQQFVGTAIEHEHRLLVAGPVRDSDPNEYCPTRLPDPGAVKLAAASVGH